MAASAKTDAVPCLKGVSLRIAIERLRGHLSSGRITHDKLEARLDPEDLEYMQERIAPTLWYPLAHYERICLLIGEIEGAVDDAYWVRFGRETAHESLSSAPVQILIGGARKFGHRAGVPLVKLAELFFNFSHWSFEGDSLKRFTIEIRDAEPMPDIVRHAVQGFIQYLLNEFIGEEVPIRNVRPRRGLIVFEGGD